MIEANISADAQPAARPMRTIAIISCPAPFERLEVVSTPTIGDRTTRKPYVELRPAARRPPVEDVLANDVGQQAEETRALDGARELTLLLGGHGGDAARHDLAALGDVTHQQLGVLVIDLRRIRTRERAGLAATEKRTAWTAVAAESTAFTIAAEAAIAVATEAAFAVTAETAAAIVALAVTIGLAHHRRGTFLVLFDADGEVADDVFADPLLALDLRDRSRGSIDVEQHEMRLAVLVHAVGQRAHAPVLGLGDLAAEPFDDPRHLGGQLFDLLGARILTREKNMLIKRHGCPFLCWRGSRRQALRDLRKGLDNAQKAGARDDGPTGPATPTSPER